ncbi:N-acetylmuramoyl-L-alanine amidase [Virgibacillus byunsanensis]|uniref:N-acetylmuramoyl-L-alanine amidase n=1 Tax=Virgibacillus byunsanensis TaxID=570945 RepID=A0ABW3LQ75_9BACI
MVKPILIIDPGHGGSDPGGGSNKYWMEKDMNLAISLYQWKRYKELGVPAAITRKNDQTLTPIQRTKLVRESGAMYCYTNHINAGGGDGAELIHSIYGDKKMAMEISTEIRSTGQNVRRVFTRTLPNNPRRDYYYMNRDTGSVVTVIIEYGFADSKEDDIQQINKHWKRYAEAVVKGFCQFSGYPYKKPTNSKSSNPTQETTYLQLPANAESWRIYSLEAQPSKGNERGFLRPSKFGGLTYEILGSTQNHVYLIHTRDFGDVQIYAHPSTGATFSN